MNKLFTGKKVLIMGLGIQGGGLGAAKFFVEQGAQVTITDLKSAKELAASLEALAGLPVRYVLGKHDEEDFKSHDLVLRNPDVSRDSPYLAIARTHNIPIEMEEALFLKLLGRRDVIGITGTRGKTTTTMMIAAIFQSVDHHVIVGGNIRGVSTLQLLAQVQRSTKIVLELSSWQLQAFHDARISPQYSVITNVYPDHLNRYHSMDAYVADKKAIFLYQSAGDHLFLHKHNEYTAEFARDALGVVHLFDAQDTHGWNLSVLGEHNRYNAAAARSTAQVFGIDEDDIRTSIEAFVGIPYRQEQIAAVGGVRFINDSASTTPEATLAALTALPSPIVLIAGGADKGLAYGILGDAIDQMVKAVVLLEGSGTDNLQAAIKHRERIRGRVASMQEAVAVAFRVSDPGDTIVLSPGFASFGLFRNEFDRGDQFREAVRHLSTL